METKEAPLPQILLQFKPCQTGSHIQHKGSANQEKGQNGQNFLPLSQISEQERIEIIQKGFQLNQQGKISLKKYYGSTDQNSLLQSKGYSIKYEKQLLSTIETINNKKLIVFEVLEK